MALATKCPHCNTIFRVAHDQLKLRGGIVRCGACNEVFDGNAALVEPVAKPSPVMPSVPVAFAPVEPPHHLDPETVAGALAEERLHDDAPSAPELVDAMPASAGGLPVGDAAYEPSPTEQDIIPDAEPAAPIDDESSPEVTAPADEESVAPSGTDADPAAEASAAADPESAAPADTGFIAPADGDSITLDESIPADDKAIAMADEEAGRLADAGAIAATEADSVVPTEVESTVETDTQAVADDFASAAKAAATAPSSGDTQADDEALPDDQPPPPAEEQPAAAHEPSAGQTSEEQAHETDDDAASRAEAQAGSLDFIVDPDEFTDPLASPQPQDTAREHLVAAALDEAHHFDDLPAEAAAADAASVDESQAEDVPAVSEEQEAHALQDEEANRNADEAAAADLISAAPESASLAATGSAAAATTVAAVVDVDDEGSAEEPGFVKRANRRQRLHRISKAVMAFGSPILLAALVAQGVTTFRNPLAAAFPALKPTLNTLCEPLGCKVNLPMQIDMLAIEQGELQTLADNTFSFATVLRNQARSAQSWPSIELTLNDASDKALVRRVFAPRDYLPSQADVDKGFAPRSEQSIKLYFELSQVKASGYHIAIFYP